MLCACYFRPRLFDGARPLQRSTLRFRPQCTSSLFTSPPIFPPSLTDHQTPPESSSVPSALLHVSSCSPSPLSPLLHSPEEKPLTRIRMRDPGRIFIADHPAQRRYAHERHGSQRADEAAPEDGRFLVRRPAQVADRLAPELLRDRCCGHACCEGREDVLGGRVAPRVLGWLCSLMLYEGRSVAFGGEVAVQRGDQCLIGCKWHWMLSSKLAAEVELDFAWRRSLGRLGSVPCRACGFTMGKFPTTT